jgi:hypothetical protein
MLVPLKGTNAMKIIAATGSLIVAVLLGLFGLVSFGYWPNMALSFVPVALTVGLLSISAILIVKRDSQLSLRTKAFIGAVLGTLVITCSVLNIYIRHERRILQARAVQFLSRPVPVLFDTNFLGGYESGNANVLSRSRALIARYANNGRIRWSAAIQGQMASAPFGIAACEEAASTNPEALRYVTECKAILDEEWRMGFWQWVEDTMEMKRKIPEIEEEDVLPRSRSE